MVQSKSYQKDVMIYKVILIVAIMQISAGAAVSPETCTKIMKSKLCLAFYGEQIEGCKDGIEVDVHFDSVCLAGSVTKCEKTMKKCLKVLHPTVNVNKD